MKERNMRGFLPFLLPMFLGMAQASAAALSSLGLMTAAAWLIAAAAYQPPLYQLSQAILGVRACGLLRAILRYGERCAAHDAAFRLLGFLRLLAYKSAAAAPPRQAAGELADFLIHGVDDLKEVYLRALLPVSTAAAVILAAGTAVYFYAPAVSYLLAAAFFFIAFAVPYGVKCISQKREEIAAGRGREVQGVYLDMIYGCPDLLAAGRAADMLAKAEKLAGIAAAEKMRLFRRQTLNGVAAELACGVMILSALAVLLSLAGEGKITGIQLTVIVFVVQSAAEVLLPLPSVWQYYARALHAARRLFSPPREKQALEKGPCPARGLLPPLLSAHGVSFSYDGQAALRDISFSIFRGGRIALVGASGAGKSTLCSLILAFCRQENGCMALNDISYSQLSAEAVRENFNVVLQEAHFFQRTIRENFQMLRPGCGEEAMWKALQQAGADGFVKALPGGLDAGIGRHGGRLSGGQRQRLALAAAFLRPAPILLLDEPTRGLDAYAAAQFRKTVFSLPTEQTILLVTHELADLEAADCIIVLEDGRVAEIGRYRELMEKKGVFYHMRRYC